MLLALLLMSFTGPLDVAGFWATENGRAHVEITQTQSGSIRGEIIWYASHGTADDPGNVLGSTLLKGFRKDGDVWSGGTITDLKSGRNYRAILTRLDEDRLAVEGCLFVFCRTQTWQRLDPEDARRLDDGR